MSKYAVFFYFTPSIPLPLPHLHFFTLYISFVIPPHIRVAHLCPLTVLCTVQWCRTADAANGAIVGNACDLSQRAAALCSLLYIKQA